jgi:hypothetical protein
VQLSLDGPGFGVVDRSVAVPQSREANLLT